MTTETGTFDAWLQTARIAHRSLSPENRALLHAAFEFLQRCGRDSYSLRLLSHFLLHCNSGLKVAQIARLLGISRPTTSNQQGLSSKEVVQAAHHRMAGRPHGKLLPRYAGPIAQFLIEHPHASRFDLIEFLERTWNVHVSTVALHHFLKKYGLDHASRSAPLPSPKPATPSEPPPKGLPVPLPPRDFFLHRPTTPGPSF